MKMLRIASLIALAVSAVNAQPTKSGAVSINIPFERVTLPNGLEVILAPDHTIPQVAVDVWYHVGSKNEVPGRTGFAHMFEHVMFTGSGHVPYGMHDRLTEGQDQVLRERSVELSGGRALARIGPHGISSRQARRSEVQCAA